MKGLGTILIDWSIDEGGRTLVTRNLLCWPALIFLPSRSLPHVLFFCSIGYCDGNVCDVCQYVSIKISFLYSRIALLSVRGFGWRFFSFLLPSCFGNSFPETLFPLDYDDDQIDLQRHAPIFFSPSPSISRVLYLFVPSLITWLNV